MSALDSFMTKVSWAPLDVLVIDMPPGTGESLNIQHVHLQTWTISRNMLGQPSCHKVQKHAGNERDRVGQR